MQNSVEAGLTDSRWIAPVMGSQEREFQESLIVVSIVGNIFF